jgi:hypothetical protein
MDSAFHPQRQSPIGFWGFHKTQACKSGMRINELDSALLFLEVGLIHSDWQSARDAKWSSQEYSFD